MSVYLIVSCRSSMSWLSYTEGINVVNPSWPQHINLLWEEDMDAWDNLDKCAKMMESWLQVSLEILLAKLVLEHRQKYGGLPHWSSPFLYPYIFHMHNTLSIIPILHPVIIVEGWPTAINNPMELMVLPILCNLNISQTQITVVNDILEA